MGYIYWSNNKQTLSYKDLRLSMRGLREFIAGQVSRAQAELAGLFLLHEDKAREEVVPRLTQGGWCNKRMLHLGFARGSARIGQPWLHLAYLAPRMIAYLTPAFPRAI
jgi:hypothetical protein